MTRVAIVGATGAVGEEMIGVLEERDFPIDELRLLASPRSAGKTMRALGEDREIRVADGDAFEGIDLALFSAGSGTSKELAPAARAAGALVVDNSSAFRMDPKCPLVVPEVNGDTLKDHGGIIANPNCSTILLVMALNPIARAAGLRRIIVCTYQAVSGAGARALEEMRAQEAAESRGREPEAEAFPKVIAHNVIPFVQAIDPEGYTTEESKVREETRRILGQPELPVSATCVRVPVWRAHAEALHVELEKPLDVEAAKRVLAEGEGVVVSDDELPTPREIAGKDGVHVGRIRKDRAFDPGLALWAVMDQLRKGAALNTVQIAERALGVGRKGA